MFLRFYFFSDDQEVHDVVMSGGDGFVRFIFYPLIVLCAIPAFFILVTHVLVLFIFYRVSMGFTE